MQAMRTSDAQKTIMKMLGACPEPMSATALGKRMQPTHKTTIYRALDALLKSDMVHALEIDGRTMYELSEGGHHHHAICTGCRKIEHIPFCGIKEMEWGLGIKDGFAITGHALEFFGTCASCGKK